MKNIDCSKLKKETYECIQKRTPTDIYDSLRVKAYDRIKETDELRINSKIVGDCNWNNLAECLNKKYGIEKSDESSQHLMEYFTKQYYLNKKK